MPSDDDDRDYEVGRGKPPKHSQWKKGESGNPSGKNKKEDSFRAILEKLASEEILVQKNGTPISMTRKEAIVFSVLAKAMKGELACVKFIHSELGLETVSMGSTEAPELSADMLGVLKGHTNWVGLCEAAEAKLSDSDDAIEEVNDDDTD